MDVWPSTEPSAVAPGQTAFSGVFVVVDPALPRSVLLTRWSSTYEHQKPLLSVAWLIGLHLPGPGLLVVPQSRQIQVWPC